MDVKDATSKILEISKISDDNFKKLLSELKSDDLNKNKDIEIEIYKQMIVNK